jgi:hypothetical protein
LVFIDDILIYSASWVDHLKHLRMVFGKLREHQFYLKRSKCAFGKTELLYLGHIISQDGVSIDPSKTDAMNKWPTPTSVTQLRGFLGLTEYYRRFVKHYGIIAKPLTNLLKHKAFHWSPEAGAAFQQLKQAMCDTPVLALPNFEELFVVETDACMNGIGAVLMQRNRPIAYLSKALSEKNQLLSIYDKDFLALLMTVERWRQYLQRAEFVIRTDHKALSFLTEQVLQSDLQKKAMARLMGLQYKIFYKQGKENIAVDALSRVGHFMALQTLTEVKPLWVQEVLNSYVTDEEAQRLLAELVLHSPNEQGFSVQQGVIRRGSQIWIAQNSALRTKIIVALHGSIVGGHSGCLATYQRVKRLFWWKGLKSDVKLFVQQCANMLSLKESFTQDCSNPFLFPRVHGKI